MGNHLLKLPWLLNANSLFASDEAGEIEVCGGVCGWHLISAGELVKVILDDLAFIPGLFDSRHTLIKWTSARGRGNVNRAVDDFRPCPGGPDAGGGDRAAAVCG
jgi:hypothetical protein